MVMLKRLISQAAYHLLSSGAASLISASLRGGDRCRICSYPLARVLVTRHRYLPPVVTRFVERYPQPPPCSDTLFPGLAGETRLLTLQLLFFGLLLLNG